MYPIEQKTSSIYRLGEEGRGATKEGKSLLGAPAKGGGVGLLP